MESVNLTAKLTGLINKYKHAVLVLLIGILLMLFPTGTPKSKETETTQPSAEIATNDLESQLEEILRQISGAGEVDVLLTEQAGREILYQTEGESDTDDTSISKRESVVIVEDSANRESALVRRTDPPIYLGAVVVCQGADHPKVKLDIVEAVCCATGLGADQVIVVKMK